MKRDVIRSTSFVHDAAELILQHARTALAERDPRTTTRRSDASSPTASAALRMTL